MVSLLCKNFIAFHPQLVLHDTKHFWSILTHLSNLSFFLYQKFPLLSYNLRNVFTKQFPKMQEHLFANVLQSRYSYKFPDIHKKIPVLKSLFNTVRGLKAYNFNKKEMWTQVFSHEYNKNFQNSYFMEHLRWLLLNMVEEFLRISNTS